MTIFVNVEKLRISNLGAKILPPKSGNRCHFWLYYALRVDSTLQECTEVFFIFNKELV